MDILDLHSGEPLQFEHVAQGLEVLIFCIDERRSVPLLSLLLTRDQIRPKHRPD